MPQLNQKLQYFALKDKWVQRHRDTKEKLWSKHKDSLNWIQDKIHPKELLAGSLGGLLFIGVPSTQFLPPAQVDAAYSTPVVKQDTNIQKINLIDKKLQIDSSNQFMDRIKNPPPLHDTISKYLPQSVEPLTDDQTKKVINTLTDYYNIKISSELNGISLNRNYGYIGEEQHLVRYPGDNVGEHFSNAEDARNFTSSGLAPGRGAWGYFAQSRESLTEEDILREKYYIAVPTFLSPGYNENVTKYYNFFKYRKMLVVNPDNGNAIVADIGDSGPAPFTGKQLGGSPEVMGYLKRVDGAGKGPVLYFFIDDPDNKISLGPVNGVK